MKQLTLAQRAADAVTAFCGSWTFILTFTALTVGWMIGSRNWDPYPFILLNLFLTVVSTFQSPLIMMSQNRQADRDREAVQGLHEKLDILLIGRARTPDYSDLIAKQDKGLNV